MTAAGLSFRIRILLVVVTVSVVPLALVGLWLTRSAQRSGLELLEVRLAETLDQAVSRIGNGWLKQRSDVLFLAEDPGVQHALASGVARRLASGEAGRLASGESDRLTPDTEQRLQALFAALDPSIAAVAIHDLEGRALWQAERPSDDVVSTVRQSLPIYQRFPSRELGVLHVELRLGELLGDGGLPPTVAGMVLGARDGSTRAQLLSLPFDAALLERERFSWGRDQWVTMSRPMAEPAVTLVAAAPLSPFAGPFEAAANRGVLWLAVVALAGVVATYLLTLRMTRSLEALVTGAEAVAGGDLDVRIPEPGTDEVGRVAEAFNSMTASLRSTLRELSSRERLAAVGEFAASLAHEVRNPLTAIRIDLQRVEEALAEGSELREAQARALREISRLDATVSETLDVARTGRWQSRGVDLAEPLRAAADAAGPAFGERGAELDTGVLDGEGPVVDGDERALEQLFLNLMLNAAHALEPGGRAWLEVSQGDADVLVSVRDTGIGIEPGALDRVFDPLYTTRANGTGLGLSVVRRIVDEHGGEIEIESEVGVGTTVHVRLPTVDAPPPL